MTARRSLLDRVSVVWLVPIGAVAIAVGVAWHTWNDRGPLVSIYFKEASGVVRGETELRYRDVQVGAVESVGFTEGLSLVEVKVRVEKEVAPYIDEDALFWVVRPQVNAQGISGLSTVLGGVYIEGSWDVSPGITKLEHQGLENPPLVSPNEEGMALELRARSGQELSEGMPVYYRGIEVGRVGTPVIGPDGNSILAPAFIFAPHHERLTEHSRFWETSGISFSLGTQGARLEVASLAALLRGGVSFDTMISGGSTPGDDEIFDLYATREDADASIYQRTTGRQVRVAVLFQDNLPGLAVGATVTFGGLEVGEVSNLQGIVDEERFGDDRVRLLATLSLEFDELAMSAGIVSNDQVIDFLEDQVDSGLRARLSNASLITGGLKVELITLDTGTPAQIDRTDPALPILPSAPADVADLGNTAEGLLARINQLPVEDLLASAIGFLDNAGALVSNPDIQAVPGDVRALLGDIRGVVGDEAFQDLPIQLAALADQMRGVLADLRTEEGVAKLVAAVEQAGRAAEAIGVAAEELPGLVAQIEAVAAKAAALPLEQLVAEASGVVADARGLIGGEAAQALPASLDRALSQVSAAAGEATALLSDLTEADAAARLTQAIETAAEAAGQIGTAAEGLPSLLTQIEAVAAKANALPLEDLLAQANGVLTSAQGILGNEAAQALPASLDSALTQVSAAAGEATALLSDLTQADAAARLTQAIETAAEAATGAASQIGTAAEGLPSLLTQIEAVAAKANALPLEDLLAQANGVLTSAQGILGTEAAQSLPASLDRALSQVSAAAGEATALLSDLTEADAAARLTQAIETAAEAATGAASQIGTAAEGLPALVAQLDTLAAKANGLPLEDLVAQTSALAAAARDVIGTEAARALPETVASALTALSGVATEADALLAGLNEADVAARLTDTLTAAAEAASGIEAATTGIPDLISRIDALAAQAATLPLEQLVTDASGILASARSILNTEAAQALPETVAASLKSMDAALAEATTFFDDLNALQSADKLVAAVEAAGQAAADVSASVEGVPDLVTEIQSVATRVNELAIEELLTDIDQLIRNSDALVGSDSAQALPGNLNAAMAEVKTALEELREGGTVENLNATLASARQAADSVAGATEALPGLVTRTEAVLRDAQAALATVGQNGNLNREAEAALRAIGRAAESIQSLARAIERKPNSLLTGR